MYKSKITLSCEEKIFLKIKRKRKVKNLRQLKNAHCYFFLIIVSYINKINIAYFLSDEKLSLLYSLVFGPVCLSWLLYSWRFDPCTFRASSYSVTILFLEFLSLRYRISAPWQLGIDLWMSTSTCRSFLIPRKNVKREK